MFFLFQEKLAHFENVEELVERLEQQVKSEKSYVQWYYDENEKLKIQTAKMADTIRTLERSKFEFEQSVRELSDTNKDLNNDVKRLEQKLEIYTELFDKDSNFHSSLKRRSYSQGDHHLHQEQADEKLIENALAPLMEEIKEKDAQIRNLQKVVEEKEVIVNSLNKEIDTLETNLAAMVTEKIRNMQITSDDEHIRQQTRESHNSLFTTDTLKSLKQPAKYLQDPLCNKGNEEASSKAQKNENRTYRVGEAFTLVLSKTDLDSASEATSPNSSNGGDTASLPQTGYASPTLSQSPPKETYLALTSKHNNVNNNSRKDSLPTVTGVVKAIEVFVYRLC